MRDWQAFNAGHVLSHLRPDLDPPLRDWLAWLLNLAPQQRPQSVAQALDVLMLSMHTGFAYMPQQAPVMAPVVYGLVVPGVPPQPLVVSCYVCRSAWVEARSFAFGNAYSMSTVIPAQMGIQYS